MQREAPEQSSLSSTGAWRHDLMSTITKAELHRLIDELADHDLAVVGAFAEFLHSRQASTAPANDDRPDSLLAFLAVAPLDDELTLPDEDASVDEALREFARGDFSPEPVA